MDEQEKKRLKRLKSIYGMVMVVCFVGAAAAAAVSLVALGTELRLQQDPSLQFRCLCDGDVVRLEVLGDEQQERENEE